MAKKKAAKAKPKATAKEKTAKKTPNAKSKPKPKAVAKKAAKKAPTKPKATDERYLPYKPTDEQIRSWLEVHKLPPECLEPVRTWIDAREDNSVTFGPGFAVNVASIAFSCMVDYEDAFRLEECVDAFSPY